MGRSRGSTWPISTRDTAGDLTVFAGAWTGLLADDDVAVAAAEIEAASAAVIIVYENKWAPRFVAAVRRNAGVLIASQRIGVPALADALAATDAAA
jgi:hypothetical protein